MSEFRERYEQAVKNEVQGSTTLVVRFQTFLCNVHKAANLLSQIDALPSSEDVGSVSVGYSYMEDADAEVTLYLKEDRQESPLIRDLARAFHLTLTKSKHWDESSLDAEALVDRVRLKVSGYKPSTCRIVEEVEDVPATRKTVKRIVCDDPEEGVTTDDVPY